MELNEWCAYEVRANLIPFGSKSKYCCPIRYSSSEVYVYVKQKCLVPWWDERPNDFLICGFNTIFTRPYHIVNMKGKRFKSRSFAFFICRWFWARHTHTIQYMLECLIGEPYQILIIHFKGFIHLNNDENVIDAWINRFWTISVLNFSMAHTRTKSIRV